VDLAKGRRSIQVVRDHRHDGTFNARTRNGHGLRGPDVELSCAAKQSPRLANHLRRPVETDRLYPISVDELTKQPARPAADVENLPTGQVSLSDECRCERTEVAAAKASIRRC
jgi:hypothetical protein